MKVARFKNSNGAVRTGIIQDGVVREIEGDLYSDYSLADTVYPLSEIAFLPPCAPSKIVAVGLNYKDHAAEMKSPLPEEPLIFLKPSTALIGHEDDIIYPDYMTSWVDFEGELAVVIGKETKWITEDDWREHVFGFTCINDVSARDLQAKDGQFTRAKGFDTFAPMGPVIETELDPSALEIKTTLNGEVKQNSNTSRLIFPVPRIVSFISRVMTLLPGDVVATGTPSGVGPMQKGDTVEVEIEGIGVLRNYVK